MVYQFKLTFVALHLFLLLDNLSTGAVFPVVFSFFSRSLLRFVLFFKVNLTVLLFRVELLNRIRALFTAGFTELSNVARERFSEHLRVETRELLEKLLKHKLFGQGVGTNSSESGVIECSALA